MSTIGETNFITNALYNLYSMYITIAEIPTIFLVQYNNFIIGNITEEKKKMMKQEIFANKGGFIV